MSNHHLQDTKMPGTVTPSRTIHNPYKKVKVVQPSASYLYHVYDKESSAIPPVRKEGTGTNMVISPEQRRRMQANKERALMLLTVSRSMERANGDAGDASDAARVTSTGIGISDKLTNTYITPVKLNRAQEETENKKQFSTVTPEQRERIEANRRRALQLRQEMERQELLSVQCPRCFQPSNNQELCIVWRHSRQPMEEHPSRIFNIFCSPCCRRVDPQPCFIGTHIPPGTAAAAHSFPTTSTSTSTVRCECGELARLQRCHNAGLNHGRYYYRCWVPFGRPHCDYFHWADKLHGLSHRPNFAPDGVSEWQHLHADPFDEDLCRRPHALVRQDQTRERLVAACLVKQMVLEATSGDFLQCLQTVEELRHMVNRVLVGGSAVIVRHLFPLTGTQIQQRLGYEGGVDGVTDPVSIEECNTLLDKLLETNPVLRATVQRIDSAWLDLQYLGNYFKI